MVFFVFDLFDPGFVVHEPLHGAAQAGLEGFLGGPAEFCLDLAAINGIAAVVSGAIFDVGDEGFGGAVQLGALGVHGVDDGVDDVDVFHLAHAADVVGLANAALEQGEEEAAAVVLDIKPVADVGAISINGQVLAADDFLNHQGHELLWELKGPVVVGAVRGDERQIEGVNVGAGEVIAAGLAGGVRAVWSVRRRLRKGGVGGAEGAEDLIGGDVQEAEVILPGGAAFFVVLQRGIEQAEGADEVRHDEVLWAIDAAVHVGLRSEVHDGIDVMVTQEFGETFAVEDVALHKNVAGIVLQCGEVGEVPGVGQLVQVDDALNFHAMVLPGLAEEIVNEVGADKSGAAGDKDAHRSHG